LSFSDFTRRSPDVHAAHVQEVLNGSCVSVCGVKKNCILHEYLRDFHVTTGFPPDIAHDLLEGIVPVELALCFSVFVSKAYFDLPWFNSLLKSFPFKFKDAVNRPQAIPETYSVTGTIGGNATENWTLIRLLPVLIGNKIPADDNAWHLIMELKDIVELCFAPVISEHAVGYLAMKIADHKRLFHAVFPDKCFKPKHHYVDHYPQLIREFGPLTNMWTMRFEAKHSYFKRVVNESHCFKSILTTLAEKHQLLVAYHLSSPTYFTPDLVIPDTTPVGTEILSSDYKEAVASVAPDVEEVSFLSFATVSATKYSKGMVVVTGFNSGLPKLAEIANIALISGKVYLFVIDTSTWYAEHIRGYLYEPNDNLQLIELSQLHDFYPLVPYTYDNMKCIMLKHFICIPWYVIGYCI